MQAPVVLISGANRGIGQAIAERLARAGFQLSLGVRHPETLHSEHHVAHFDALERDSAQHWVNAAAAHYGRIDAVIHCAGILEPCTLLDGNEDALDRMWQVNAKGPLRLTRAVWPWLVHSGRGRVISVISLSGVRVKGAAMGYSMSKFAQRALHQSIRNQGWEFGIRACAICPSWVNTEMASSHSRLAPEQMSQAEDIAELVLSALRLPNNAVVDEIAVNCQLEMR